MFKKLLLLNALCAGILFGQTQVRRINLLSVEGNSFSEFNGQLCAVPGLTLETEFALNDYMRINHPQTYNKMKTPPILARIFDVGDLENFWVIQDDSEGERTRVEIGAKLLAQGSRTAIWADTLHLNSSNISTALAEGYIKLLENSTPAVSKDSTLGIYDLEKLYFGDVPDKDGDGRVDILFSKIFSGAGGYFSPLDQTSMEGSNIRDIIYIQIGMAVSFTEGTLSHELQHLIHYNYDSLESSEFNEGLSELATIICGGEYISHSFYLSKPSLSFNWPTGDQVGSAENYSMASLFAVYFSEQFGLPAIKEFITFKSGSSPARGIPGFNQYLSEKIPGLDFPEFFKNWLIANYVEDKNINEKYGYDIFLPHKPIPQFEYYLANQAESSIQIGKNAGNYIKYSSSADSMEIKFTSLTAFIPEYAALLSTNDGQTIEFFNDNQTFLVDDIVNKVNEAVFLVINNTEFNLAYDFESTGEDSEFSGFVEIAYDDNQADILPSGAGWLGWGGGNNNIGAGWAMRFEPLMSSNRLVEFKLMAGFEQEFSGSSVAADADKDFEVHVWKPDESEQILTDIITPFIFSTKRSGISEQFLIVDLNEYADELKNHEVLYVGFLEDDEIGTYLALDKNKDGENYTYAMNGSEISSSFSDMSLDDGTSLDGWNYMMRATYLFLDTTKALFHAGFFQNPVFTDELDIFVLGSSLMQPSKVTISAFNGGETKILRSRLIPGNDSILVVRDYRISDSGPLEINVNGSLAFGSEIIDTTFRFNVNYILARTGANIISENGSILLEIPPFAINEDAFFILSEGNSAVLDKELNNSLYREQKTVYSLSPVGKYLLKPALLTLVVPADLEDAPLHDLTIGYWNGTYWEDVESISIKEQNKLQASILKLGNYAVMAKTSERLATQEIETVPRTFHLSQNFPNPFNPETTIPYEIPKKTHVKITVYDILGQEIVILENKIHNPGLYKTRWNGQNSGGSKVVSGIYFLQLKTAEFNKINKMILAR